MYLMLSLEGRQLGNYDVIRRIRAGGMGAVYEGRQRTAFDRRVAIKVILGSYARDREMRRRFAREARTIARLHHPHILPLIEFGDEGGILYLVMPYIEDGTLTNYLRQGQLEVQEVAAMYLQLLDAVEYAHDEGLIHRDIKSSNVLLEQRRSGAPYVYLADFGLVRTTKQAAGTQSGEPIPLDQVPGTPHYMAPEQTMGIVTPLTDIYALGVLLFQMLTGELPYNDPDDVRVIEMHLEAPIPSPCDIDPALPFSLAEVTRIAMAKRPQDRFANIAELRQAFLAALDDPAWDAKTSQATSPQDEDVPLMEDHRYPEPLRSFSLPLVPLELPQPVEVAGQSALTLEQQSPLAAGKARITESIRRGQRLPRMTDSVPGRGARKRRRRKSAGFSIAAITVVPILLLALLIVPRALGISLFPVGFPLLGADPTATITITAQSKAVQDTYLLRASPDVSSVNAATRTIPDSYVSQTATATQTEQATGSATLQATFASGSIFFVNQKNEPISVADGYIFTASEGVQVQTTQAVTVPRRQNGQNGSATVPAIALSAGTAGNIAAGSISVKCCFGLLASNPSAFSGGLDVRTVPIVTQADLNKASSAVIAKLEQATLQAMVKQLGADEVLTGLPTYSTSVTPASPVGSQVSEVAVQVRVKATGIAYHRGLLDQLATQLLEQQTSQALGSSYQRAGNADIGVPRLVEQGKDGLVYLSVAVHEIWRYHFPTQLFSAWRQHIHGDTSEAALAYLNQQQGVAAVLIHLPFGTDHLPTTLNQIQIILSTS
jgi:serine/threonine protein kinase